MFLIVDVCITTNTRPLSAHHVPSSSTTDSYDFLDPSSRRPPGPSVACNRTPPGACAQYPDLSIRMDRAWGCVKGCRLSCGRCSLLASALFFFFFFDEIRNQAGADLGISVTSRDQLSRRYHRAIRRIRIGVPGARTGVRRGPC